MKTGERGMGGDGDGVVFFDQVEEHRGEEGRRGEGGGTEGERRRGGGEGRRAFMHGGLSMTLTARRGIIDVWLCPLFT